MRRGTVLALPWLAGALAILLVAAWLAGGEASDAAPRGTLAPALALRAATGDGFERAEAPREFRFPEDHGPHPGFQTEWWYFTGNLATSGGRRFGYQLTFFRSALAPRAAPRASAFAADHAWMAHFALSDLGRGRFSDFERFSREGAGLAGARALPAEVQLSDWSCEFDPAGERVQLLARAEGLSIDLALASRKPPVLHGERGLSRKNAEPGNASYYYSLTRLATTGRIETGGDTFEVEGLSWMDREWSSGTLARDQRGWDWFGLQLDDGTELMWYRLRREDGREDPFDGGTFVAADGAARSLAAGELALESRATWESPRTRAEYPARWKLSAPALELELDVSPLLADQELAGSFRYWEGAVEFRGQRGGAPVSGRGYVELVGYAAAAPEPAR